MQGGSSFEEPSPTSQAPTVTPLTLIVSNPRIRRSQSSRRRDSSCPGECPWMIAPTVFVAVVSLLRLINTSATPLEPCLPALKWRVVLSVMLKHVRSTGGASETVSWPSSLKAQGLDLLYFVSRGSKGKGTRLSLRGCKSSDKNNRPWNILKPNCCRSLTPHGRFTSHHLLRRLEAWAITRRDLKRLPGTARSAANGELSGLRPPPPCWSLRHSRCWPVVDTWSATAKTSYSIL